MHDMEQEDTVNSMREDDSDARPPSSSEDEEKVKSHSCDECGKSFTSAKALNGHTHSSRCLPTSTNLSPGSKRKAPERMESPPPQIKIQTPSVDAGLCVGLKGWGSHDIRGRSPIINPATDSSSYVNVKKERKKPKVDQEKEAGECSKAPEDQDSDSRVSLGNGPFEIEVFNKLVYALADIMRKKLDIEKRGAEEEKRAAELIIKSSTPQRRQIAATSLRRREYECNDCGKLFASYQGLGGHRHIHNSPNPTARGGRNPPTTKKKSNVVADNETAASSSSKSPSVFPFDLNKAPAEEEVGGGSSSHSSAD